MDTNTWTLVYSSNKPWQAEIAKQVLNDHGIEAVVVNKQDSNYLFGEVEVYSQPEHAARAKELLKNIES
jgi:broad specificity phosphatase PhoE